MKTVGELIKETRRSRGLTIDQVATITKIQPQFIQSLEKNDYRNLPQSTFVKGFIRNIAQSLGKNPKNFLAVFRRDFGEDAKGKVVPRGMSNPLNQPKLRWTPKATAISAATIIITVVLTYLIFQFRILSGVPNLNVKSPQENQTVSTLITVEGNTSPQATVKINNKQVTVSDSGEFSETISLSQGQHTITIESISRTGKTNIVQRNVLVE